MTNIKIASQDDIKYLKGYERYEYLNKRHKWLQKVRKEERREQRIKRAKVVFFRLNKLILFKRSINYPEGIMNYHVFYSMKEQEVIERFYY